MPEHREANKVRRLIDPQPPDKVNVSRPHDKRDSAHPESSTAKHVCEYPQEIVYNNSQDEPLPMYFSSGTSKAIEVPPRRPTRPLATQLIDHINVCFEEDLFSPALFLLSNALTSGAVTRVPASIPRPAHLALAATIAVHPTLTTRTVSKDNHAASDRALKYLRQLVDTVEVQKSGMREAFRFVRNSAGLRNSRSKRARTRKHDASADSDEETDVPVVVRSRFADKKSLWTNAEDFWTVVGWAFNCSVCHKARWERWKAWLELMLDVLGDDLERTYASGGDLKDTLIAHYLSPEGSRHGDKRRIMRAILADGKSQEFGEIWKDETKPPKKEADNERPAKRTKLDLDNGEYGDYFEESEDESLDRKKRRSRSVTAFSTKSRRSLPTSHVGSNSDEEEEDDDEMPDDAPAGIEAFGGMESIRLRQRFIAVLTRFSRISTGFAVARDIFMDIEELFDLFTEFMRPLPLPVFRHFISPLKPFLTADLQADLNEMLSRPLLGGGISSGELSQADLENRLAPKCAINTTVEDNAKVSLLVEGLLRKLWKEDKIKGDLTNLRERVEEGIKARDQKIKADGRKKKAWRVAASKEAHGVLQSSGERMRALISVLAK